MLVREKSRLKPCHDKKNTVEQCSSQNYLPHILKLYYMGEILKLLDTKNHLEALIKNIPTPEILVQQVIFL